MKTEEYFNDSIWIDQFRQKNEGAMKDVYELYGGSLFSFASNMVSNEEEAKDIVAESFVKLWERSDVFKGIRNIKAYLYVITRNACISYLRKTKKIRAAYKEFNYLAEVKEQSVMNKMIHNEFMKLVNQKIEELPDVARKVFKMTYIDGLEPHQVAEALDMPPENVKNNKSRALALLKLRLFTQDLMSVGIIIFLFAAN